MNVQTLFENNYFLLFIGLWELTWKGFALWKAARNEHKYWFISILLINSIGLLPIIYLVIQWYKDKDLKKITWISRLKRLLTDR